MKSIFVYNPESGKGLIKKYKDYILKKLSKKYGEIECVETTHAGHAHDLAKEAVSKYDYFFVSGGDGTLNEVINGMGNAENKPVIGYIPSGTVNDVARSLGISLKIKRAVKNLLVGEPFEHDIFRVNRRYGIYVCCTGLFTKSSYDTERYNKKKYGKFAYVKKGLEELLNAKPVSVELTINGETIKKDCVHLMILNSKSVAGFKINRKAKLDDGEVEIILFHSKKKKIFGKGLWSMFNTFLWGVRRYHKHDEVTYLKASSFEIATEEGTVINLDGEKSKEGTFNFTVIPKGVKIIAPKRNKNNTIDKN